LSLSTSRCASQQEKIVLNAVACNKNASEKEDAPQQIQTRPAQERNLTQFLIDLMC
jgi:hypothetical protein